MKKLFLCGISVLLLAVTSLYAADGDIIVNGKLGVGGGVGVRTDQMDRGSLTALGVAGTNKSNYAALTPGATNGEKSAYSLYSTFENYPSDPGPRRTADIIAGFNGGTWGTEYLSLNVGGATDARNITSEKVRITADGNVGIGRTSPAGKLHVYGPYGSPSLTSDTTNIMNVNSESSVQLAIGALSISPYSIWLQTKQHNNSGNSYAIALNPLGGNVGIGTSDPGASLDVRGSVHLNSLSIANNAGAPYSGNWIGMTTGVGDEEMWLHICGITGSDSARRAAIYADKIFMSGNVGIGRIPTNGKLDVDGDIMVRTGIIRSGQRSDLFLALQPDRNLVLYDNQIPVWASVTQTSDIRLKKNIVQLTDVLPKIIQLTGVKFNWIDENWAGQPEIGVIAQEVEKFFPEIVTTDQNSGYKLVQYEKLSPILLEAIKELKTENDDLKEKMIGLEKKIAQIEKRLEKNKD